MAKHLRRYVFLWVRELFSVHLTIRHISRHCRERLWRTIASDGMGNRRRRHSQGTMPLVSAFCFVRSIPNDNVES